MTNEEAKAILAKLKVMFPNWYSWFLTVDTKAETAKAWQRAIESQDLVDCEEVLRNWETGKAKCPETYERDRVVFLLVEAARVIRNGKYIKEQARSQIATYSEQRQQVEQRRRAYRPIRVKGLGEAGRKFQLAVDAIQTPKSQWTKAEIESYRIKCDEIVFEFIEETKNENLYG